MKYCLLIFLFLLNSLLFAQDINKQTFQDSSDVYKKQIQLKNKNFIDKDSFGKPISKKEVEDFNNKDKEDQKEEAESYILGIGLSIFASPIYLPIKLLEDDYSETFYYQSYPFENGDGLTEFDGKKWMGNFTLSYQYVNNKAVGYKLNSSFRIFRFSIDPTYSYYNFPDKDNISKFSTTIKITFAQNQFINFRTGFGYSHFETDSKFDGINWIYEICLFQKPFNLKLNFNSTAYDFQSEKGVKFSNDFNIGFGYFFKRINIKLAYRWHKIGEETLNGPEISSSIWF